MKYTERPYAINPKDELENLRLNDAEKAIVEKFKSGELKLYNDIFKNNDTNIDHQRVVYACIFEKAIELNIGTLTPYTIEQTERTWKRYGSTYQNVQDSDPLGDIERWNAYGLIDKIEILNNIISDGYFVNNGELVRGDVLEALKSSAGFKDENGNEYAQGDILVNVWEKYVHGCNKDKIEKDTNANEVMSHINYYTNLLMTQQVENDLKDIFDRRKITLNSHFDSYDFFNIISNQSDSYVEIIISEEGAKIFKEAIEKYPNFLDELNDNALMILNRCGDSYKELEKDLKEITKNNESNEKKLHKM